MWAKGELMKQEIYHLAILTHCGLVMPYGDIHFLYVTSLHKGWNVWFIGPGVSDIRLGVMTYELGPLGYLP